MKKIIREDYERRNEIVEKAIEVIEDNADNEIIETGWIMDSDWRNISSIKDIMYSCNFNAPVAFSSGNYYGNATRKAVEEMVSELDDADDIIDLYNQEIQMGNGYRWSVNFKFDYGEYPDYPEDGYVLYAEFIDGNGNKHKSDNTAFITMNDDEDTIEKKVSGFMDNLKFSDTNKLRESKNMKRLAEKEAAKNVIKESNELYNRIFKDFIDQMKESYTLIDREYGTEYKLSQEQLDKIVENHANFYDVVTEIYNDNAFWEIEKESIDYYIDEIFKTLKKKYPDADFNEFKEEYYEQIREKFWDKSDNSLYKYFLEDGQYPAYIEWVSNYEAMAKPVNYDEDGQGSVFLDEYLNELMEQLGINPKEFAEYAKSKGYEIENEEDWKDEARNPKMPMSDFFAMIVEDEGFYWDGYAQFVMLGYVNLKDMLDTEGYFNVNGKYIVPSGAECSMINLFTGYGDYGVYPLTKNLKISLDQKGFSYWRLSMDTDSIDTIYGYTPEHEIEDGGVYSNLLLKKANVVESKKNIKENKEKSMERKSNGKRMMKENRAKRTIKEYVEPKAFEDKALFDDFKDSIGGRCFNKDSVYRWVYKLTDIKPTDDEIYEIMNKWVKNKWAYKKENERTGSNFYYFDLKETVSESKKILRESSGFQKGITKEMDKFLNYIEKNMPENKEDVEELILSFIDDDDIKDKNFIKIIRDIVLYLARDMRAGIFKDIYDIMYETIKYDIIPEIEDDKEFLNSFSETEQKLLKYFLDHKDIDKKDIYKQFDVTIWNDFNWKENLGTIWKYFVFNKDFDKFLRDVIIPYAAEDYVDRYMKETVNEGMKNMKRIMKESNELINSINSELQLFNEIGYFGEGTWLEAKRIADSNNEGWRLPNVLDAREMCRYRYEKLEEISGSKDFFIWTDARYSFTSSYAVENESGYVDEIANRNKLSVFLIR